MSQITNNKILSEGWRVTSQTPIDDRLIFANVADMINLGTDSQEAYRYYEGMRCWIINDRKEYEWRESVDGELTSSFIYPSGVVSNAVDYSNRGFNWVEVETGSNNSSLVSVQSDTVASLLALTPLPLAITGAVGIIDVQVYNSTLQKITDGINIKVASNQVILESNVALVNLTVKTTY